jgi:hypothetical protein
MATVSTALWPERWPAIALQECIDKVEAAAQVDRAQVKFDLPCIDCDQSTRCLNAKRKELGPLLYDREIQTSPRTGDSSLFPPDLIDPCLRKDLQLVKYWRPMEGEEARYVVVQAWDLAWSERIGGDWLVCMTGRLDRETGQRRLLNVERWQRIAFDDQVKQIANKWAQYESSLVVIESDAAQSIWSKHVGRNTAVPVMPHTAGGKTDLATGIPSLLILLENKKWEFPAAPNGWNGEELDVFLSELEAFGWNDGKLQGVGEHDDTVMAWYHLNWGMDRLALKAVGQYRRGAQPKSAYI